jgi:ribosomal-protein-alanine N-acetyltransferase
VVQASAYTLQTGFNHFTMHPITIHALKATDWEPLLAFELRNRSWFEHHIDSRDESFYSKVGVQTHIAEYLQAYAAGLWFPGLVLGADKSIIGRTNLKDVDVKTGTAELGYRIAYDQLGKGAATGTVNQVKMLAQSLWNLKQLNAVVNPANLASIRVLKKCGFASLPPTLPEPLRLIGQQRNLYQCMLS